MSGDPEDTARSTMPASATQEIRIALRRKVAASVAALSTVVGLVSGVGQFLGTEDPIKLLLIATALAVFIVLGVALAVLVYHGRGYKIPLAIPMIVMIALIASGVGGSAGVAVSRLLPPPLGATAGAPEHTGGATVGLPSAMAPSEHSTASTSIARTPAVNETPPTISAESPPGHASPVADRIAAETEPGDERLLDQDFKNWREQLPEAREILAEKSGAVLPTGREVIVLVRAKNVRSGFSPAWIAYIVKADGSAEHLIARGSARADLCDKRYPEYEGTFNLPLILDRDALDAADDSVMGLPFKNLDCSMMQPLIEGPTSPSRGAS